MHNRQSFGMISTFCPGAGVSYRRPFFPCLMEYFGVMVCDVEYRADARPELQLKHGF